MQPGRVVIVGSGHAGDAVAAALRQFNFENEIVLIGEEGFAPYQRPPLSKAYLKGELDLDRLALRAEDFYVDNGIYWRRSTTVVKIDRASCTLHFADGTRFGYGHLILATGRTPRTLSVPGSEGADIRTLRTAGDANRLRADFRPGVRLLIIGGGYVGLEVAASARSMGCEVVLLEREARLLARVASEEVAGYFHARHAAEGVSIMPGRSVVAFEPGAGGMDRVARLDDGSLLPCDVVLAGIGAVARDELALSAGLDCDDGVLVDADGRTSDPSIFAIGDVAVRRLARYGVQARLESVPSALETAKAVAAALTNRTRPAEEIPWFWSDQYDDKLQIAGLTMNADRRVTRGDPQTGRFAVFHLKGEQVEAVEAINSPADFMFGRKIMATAQTVDDQLLADPSAPLPTAIRRN